ncbi:MAG: aminodeoxychorismate/anthranilate synthase component II [Candidatus Omnitrophica bacterium]|nr:aminodeoxychorismate/anthranilate synthase component II [Candidatus Omnitrophota bacterium]MDD5351900.1 aminodeoxychorismate/anthranilate synthase component II [Candidatus Omnitrophota bacterium]MDD5550726.1 aminodeoxychorismate/anthranilate synthase component II [Candidatus Omnitrophota bacterium]
MILIVDNYDSFTYNLVQYLGQLHKDLRVFRNDKISVKKIKQLNPDKIVISPGPGRPEDAGISCELIDKLKGVIPILGVCLGHQAIGYAFGGKIIQAKRIMHGKTSMIYHNGKTIFKNIPSPFEATRYHSLVVDRKTLPSTLEITAWTKDDKEIMGLKHKDYPIWGVQFHPESILTKVGLRLLKNFLNQ